MATPEAAPGAVRFLDAPRPDLDAQEARDILRRLFGLDGRLEALDSERDQNFRVRAADGAGWVLKIANADEDPAVVDMQCAALQHVARRDPGLPVPRVIPSGDGAAWRHVETRRGARHLVRVVSWLPGTPLCAARPSPALLRGVGATLARLDVALRGFFHPAAGHALLWDVRRAPALRPYCRHIDDVRRRGRVERILEHFEREVLPRLEGLRAQAIHDDATTQNVLVDAGNPPGVAGIIDFGDMVHGPLALELASAMADVTTGAGPPWEAAAAVAAGFDEIIPLEAGELALLHDLVIVRQVLSLVIIARREATLAQGAGSLRGFTGPCWRSIEQLLAVGPEDALARLCAACRAPASAGNGAVAARLLERRRRVLMPGLDLFYDPPLHLRRGRGVWLYDAAGRAYLDAYNNVPQVGHAHPHVVNALARQSAELNTNTRYLYEGILEYAERLAAHMPGELGVCLFVNSGSEANDLAWRMARAHTGRRGAVVTAHAYHGCTEASARLSPCGMPAGGLPPEVRTMAAPDALHGPFGDGLGSHCAATLEAALGALDASGHGVAALFVDPGFCSDGIHEAPPGYLAAAFARVRAAGGVCVADEVQTGFGRLGTMWGFEACGAIPDIVTLGKPIANGYPAGAVITTPPIAASFAAGPGFFSTFGGNPVACSAGLAVLDVIEREDLCGNAREVGEELGARLRALAARHAAIGGVRGRGLLQGVALVRDGRRGATPDAETARRVVNEMRAQGVLIGIEGPHGNVLKIRPPLVLRREHAGRLVETLDRALS